MMSDMQTINAIDVFPFIDMSIRSGMLLNEIDDVIPDNIVIKDSLSHLLNINKIQCSNLNVDFNDIVNNIIDSDEFKNDEHEINSEFFIISVLASKILGLTKLKIFSSDIYNDEVMLESLKDMIFSLLKIANYQKYELSELLSQDVENV